MTKDEYIALVTEEGFTRKSAEMFWDLKPEAMPEETITVAWVRASIAYLRETLRLNPEVEADAVENGVLQPRANPEGGGDQI